MKSLTANIFYLLLTNSRSSKNIYLYYIINYPIGKKTPILKKPAKILVGKKISHHVKI